jgi:hypothetical protein
VLHPPAVDPGITDDDRRTVLGMMAKGAFGLVILAADDLDGTFERLQASAEVARSPPSSPTGSATARCATRRATWSASRSCDESGGTMTLGQRSFAMAETRPAERAARSAGPEGTAR